MQRVRSMLQTSQMSNRFSPIPPGGSSNSPRSSISSMSGPEPRRSLSQGGQGGIPIPHSQMSHYNNGSSSSSGHPHPHGTSPPGLGLAPGIPPRRPTVPPPLRPPGGILMTGRSPHDGLEVSKV
jgi:hypothetical protein